MADVEGGSAVKREHRVFACGVVLFLGIAEQSLAAVHYVKPDAAGANNGTNWADACTSVQPALDAAESGNDVRGAAGHFASTQKAEHHGRPAGCNLAFLDGHVEFITVRKGLHVADRYTIIPFQNLHADVVARQQEVPFE